MTRAAVPAMLKASGGAIVNISSIAAVVGIPLTAAYSTTKGGLDALTRCLAIDYAKQGIRCNGVCVGLIKTWAVRTGSLNRGAAIGVSINPTQTPLQRMPCLA